MAGYTVRQLAKLAGVSVRTLHHYDQIGLLVPAVRTAAGYRHYTEQDLLRLQQILFFRELDFPLQEIRAILDHPGFDPQQALREHRRLLEQQVERLTRLLATVDKTITQFEGAQTLQDEELYEGFSKEQIERYQREVREKYDPKLVEESERRVRSWSKGQWDQIKQEGDEVTRGLAALAESKQPEDPEVQALIARHHQWIEHFYPCSAEVYQGLGQLYAEHPEFRATYDKYRKDLADFMRAAMAHYAGQVLAAKK